APPPGFRVFALPAVPQEFGAQGRINLVDGKTDTLPTIYAGALRIRAAGKNVSTAIPPNGDNFGVALAVSLEPRLQWREAPSLRIDKALDDRGQALTSLMMPAPAAFAPGGIGLGFAGPAMITSG